MTESADSGRDAPPTVPLPVDEPTTQGAEAVGARASQDSDAPTTATVAAEPAPTFAAPRPDDAPPKPFPPPASPAGTRQEGAERPEVLVGAAFAGGLVLAMILRRLGH